MLSISSRKLDAASKLKVVIPASWSMVRIAKATSPCTSTWRKPLQPLRNRLCSPANHSISGPDPKEVERAKELCIDLLTNVREQYERFKENPPQRSYGGNSYGGDRSNAYGGYGAYGQQSPATPAAPTPAPPGVSGASSPTDYSAQYAQYYGGQDPYAAYGGYQNYMAYYQYYQQQATQQQAAPGAPPPGPPTEEPPPPPPPSGSPPANGGYNSVCPSEIDRLRLKALMEAVRSRRHQVCNTGVLRAGHNLRKGDSPMRQ